MHIYNKNIYFIIILIGLVYIRIIVLSLYNVLFFLNVFVDWNKYIFIFNKQ